MDLKEILPDRTGFRIRSHDPNGRLPEIVVKNSDDTFLDNDPLVDHAARISNNRN